MEFSVTAKYLKGPWAFRPVKPLRTKVMGEELAWNLHVKFFQNTLNGVFYDIRLESVLNHLKTISFYLEYDETNTPTIPPTNPPTNPTTNTLTIKQKGPFLINQTHRVELPGHGQFSLKIQLDGGEAVEHHQTLRRLYNDKATGDVEVHCGTLVIQAHKSVLGLQSDMMRVAFSNMGCVEGQTGVYKIAEEHMRPDILKDVIKWTYLHSIENAPAKVMDLLMAADYFQMSGLKEMCGRLLADTISLQNCLKVLDVAFKYNIKNLRGKCTDFFVKNRKEVLANTRNLAEVVTNIPELGLELLGIELENVDP